MNVKVNIPRQNKATKEEEPQCDISDNDYSAENDEMKLFLLFVDKVLHSLNSNQLTESQLEQKES